MKLITLSSLILVLAFSQTAYSGEWVLTNGDIIHGELIEKRDGKITIQHPVLGTIALPSSQIKHVETPPAKLADKDQGLLNTGFLANWKRSVEVGLKGSEGNSRNRHLHIGTRLKFENDQKRWDIEMAYNSSEDGGEQSRNELFAQFNRDFLIPSSTRFYFTEGRYDWDEFEDWDYRLSFGGGIGSQLIKTDDWAVNGRTGLGISKEFGGEDDEWVPEGILGIESNWAIAERHSLEFKNTLYPSLKEIGEFRNITALNWKVGLDQLNGVDFKVGLKNEFDSNTSGDSRKNDFKYHLSLVLGI